METFEEFLSKMDEPDHKERLEEILEWIKGKFPQLETAIKWNQPMFTDHGTFIIAFSTAKKHLSVAPEKTAIVQFSEQIDQAGYSQTQELFRIPWNKPVDFDLLEKIIDFNIEDKADCQSFWRP